jgi:hypothetical protein
MQQQMNEFAEAYRNPLVVAAYTFLEPLPVALPFSLVSAWLVSRSPAAPAPAGASDQRTR